MTERVALAIRRQYLRLETVRWLILFIFNFPGAVEVVKALPLSVSPSPPSTNNNKFGREKKYVHAPLGLFRIRF